MIRKFVQFLFRKPILWLISKLSSSPVREKVHAKLSYLQNAITENKNNSGIALPFDFSKEKLVIMSDLHKGSGNDADDFKTAQNNYAAACYHYLNEDFTYIALGDVEELWENKIVAVVANNETSIELEKKFLEKGQFYKVIGNHDLYWCNTPFFASKWLKKIYGKVIPVYEGILIKTKVNHKDLDFLLTHGHQGDKTSDGNKFSKWFVATIWSKIQAYLDINPNSPSKDFLLRDKHNKMMYEWSILQKNTILITGHTHKPVFASENHLETLMKAYQMAKANNQEAKMEFLTAEIEKRKQEYILIEDYILKKPSYFNTGCCCFLDGDMTVIEIADNKIQLIKWTENNGETIRKVLQEMQLNLLESQL